jgi:hypothetical protein
LRFSLLSRRRVAETLWRKAQQLTLIGDHESNHRILIPKDSSSNLNFAAVCSLPRYSFVDFALEPVTRDGVIERSLQQL